MYQFSFFCPRAEIDQNDEYVLFSIKVQNKTFLFWIMESFITSKPALGDLNILI